MEHFYTIIEGTNFTPLDWAIVALYLTISVAIGIIANRYVADMVDFVVAGRGVRTALAVATLTGTELGLVTVMYCAQKGFSGGFAAFHIGIASGIVTFFVGLTGFIVVRLRRCGAITIPDYYRMRYGKKTQIIGGLMLSLGGILNMGMFLKAGSMFIVGITGLQSEAALTWVMVGLLALVLFYTVLGGMVSVILTDYIQFVVLSLGLFIATALLIQTIGWNHIFEKIIELKGEAGFNPLMAESGFGIDYVVWMFFLGLVNCALWPTAIARTLSCDSEETVKKQYMWSSISFTIMFIVPYFWGICALVYITDTPLLQEAFFPANGVAAVDTLYGMPILMGRILPVGIIGLITASMIAAFMSTHDSYLLCWSSVLTNDVFAPILGSRMTEKLKVLLARILIVVIGVMILLISFVYPLKAELWDYMAITGAIYFTGAFALLLGGLYWRRASSTGAIHRRHRRARPAGGSRKGFVLARHGKRVGICDNGGMQQRAGRVGGDRFISFHDGDRINLFPRSQRTHSKGCVI
ncbi:MAG: sodium:solute symporter family protein [Candidatus Hinthialibacter sp.]